MKENGAKVKIRKTYPTASEAGKNTQLSKMDAEALSQLHELYYVQNCDANEPRRGQCTQENI